MFKSRLATLFIVVLVLSACSATYTDKADKGIYFYQKGKVVQSRANFNRELAGSIDDHSTLVKTAHINRLCYESSQI